MGDHQNQEAIIIAKSPEQQQALIMEPNNTCINLSHATCTTPIYCCCCSNTFMKRRSSPSSSSATATEEDLRAFKKLNFREQHGFTLNGVSTSIIPFHNSSYLMNPPLSPSVKDLFPHPTPSPSREEASNSMRLRRMKECLREMKKCWEEVMEDEIEEQLEDDYNDPEGVEVEGDKELSNKDDECGRDAEEAVKVEWVDKCLSICFKCPCSKGYQILLSGNNCYYKLI